MFVWRELEDGDTVTIKRESGHLRVTVARVRGDRVLADEQRVTVLEVRSVMFDVVDTLIRRALQRLKNER